MQAFHNDSRVKDFYVARVKAHKAAGQIVKGVYWRNGCGCAVGCTIHSSSHLSYPGILGIPVVLAHLEDRIFEGLPLWLATGWPEKFLTAIPVGADLSDVWPEFVVWRLADPKHGIIKFAESDLERQFIAKVVQLHKRRCTNEVVFRTVRLAGPSVVSTSRAAEQAVCASHAAARMDPVAATMAAVAAADAASSVAAANGRNAFTAKEGAYVRMASKLLELLRAAPVK